jgi:hypothetical protein
LLGRFGPWFQILDLSALTTISRKIAVAVKKQGEEHERGINGVRIDPTSEITPLILCVCVAALLFAQEGGFSFPGASSRSEILNPANSSYKLDPIAPNSKSDRLLA